MIRLDSTSTGATVAPYDPGVELWLIRHALPVRIDGGAAPADPALADEGVDQAARLASWWAPFGPDGVVSSTMRRARETAAPLAEAIGADAGSHDGLREFDAHLPTYVPLEELRADPAAWEAAVEAWMSPEAEDERQTFRRTVVAAVDEVAEGHSGDRLAIVCHGGVINAYLSHVLSLPGTMFFEPAYTSVSRVLLGAGHRQLVSVNETPHLGRLVLPATAS
jgi:2,3-bisphosphoglycerate-dependent phosphoglycerate mutase